MFSFRILLPILSKLKNAKDYVEPSVYFSVHIILTMHLKQNTHMCIRHTNHPLNPPQSKAKNLRHKYFHLFQLINEFFFIIKGFRTIVVIFIVISTTFQPICSPASRTHSVTVIGVDSLSFYGDNHLVVAGSILTAGE